MNNAAIHAELQACVTDGLLKPEIVVERARNPRSALHDKFTWDNTEAARQYRLIQARNLIRVHVLHDAKDASPEFVSITTDRVNPGGGYRIFADVVKDADAYTQLLRDAFTYFRNAREKYDKLKELKPVWSAVDAAESALEEQMNRKDAA